MESIIILIFVSIGATFIVAQLMKFGYEGKAETKKLREEIFEKFEAVHNEMSELREQLTRVGFEGKVKIEKTGEELRKEVEFVHSEISELIRELMKEIEHESLTEYEKEVRAFKNAPDIPLSFFEKLEKGQVASLMEGNYCYDNGDILLSHFLYKHGYIDKANKTKFGYEVHGFKKQNEPGLIDAEWSKITLLANEDKCSTSNCAVTVKRAV